MEMPADHSTFPEREATDRLRPRWREDLGLLLVKDEPESVHGAWECWEEITGLLCSLLFEWTLMNSTAVIYSHSSPKSVKGCTTKEAVNCLLCCAAKCQGWPSAEFRWLLILSKARLHSSSSCWFVSFSLVNQKSLENYMNHKGIEKHQYNTCRAKVANV